MTRVMKWPEMSIMSWVLSDPPSHKTKLAKQQLIMRRAEGHK